MTTKKQVSETNKVELGDEARDQLTGIKGIVVAVTEWIHGCRRILLQPQGVNKDGKAHDTYCADEPQVKVLRRQAVVPTGVTSKEAEAVQAGEQPQRRAGGVRPKPSSGRPGPTRR